MAGALGVKENSELLWPLESEKVDICNQLIFDALTRNYQFLQTGFP
jgi:hypothetical protein